MYECSPWSRLSYPVQSSPQDQPIHHVASPALERAATPKLPQTIRAVKDAKFQPQKGRIIVICLDGTGDKFDGDNSNIVHIVRYLKKDDPSQVTYYQSGIGTYDGNHRRV